MSSSEHTSASASASGRGLSEFLSFEEERHTLLAHAHAALSLKWREKKLRETVRLKEAQKVRTDFDKMWKDLSQRLTTASEGVTGEESVAEVVASVPDLRCEVDSLLALVRAVPGALHYVDSEILADREVMLKVVREDGLGLEHASREVQADKEVVLAAVAEDSWALEWASDALRADREVVLTAVSNHPSLGERLEEDMMFDTGVLGFASPELQNDKEIVLAAVKCDAWDLQNASDKLKSDREVVLAALKNQSVEDMESFDGESLLEAVDPKFYSDQEIVLEAIRVDGFAMSSASPELKRDKDFVLRAMRTAPEEHAEWCYEQAAIENATSPVGSRSLEDFQGACDSGLAMPGDSAPVLTITFCERGGTQARSISSCEVTMLSGASFSCNLLTSSKAASSPSPSPSPSFNAETEPARKRARQDNPGKKQHQSMSGIDSDQIELSLTVDELAKKVLAELPKHTQAVPPPDRVFILTAKRDGAGESVPLTPWDWNRPLTDFI